MSIDQIRESGILESYVLGDLEASEVVELEKALKTFPELQKDIREIELSLEKYAQAHAIAPDRAIKPMLMAVLNFMMRLQAGEKPSDPPAIHEGSKVVDYKEWLVRSDMQEPASYESMYLRIMGKTQEKTTILIWLKEGAPDETHTDEHESFLIVSGTCNVIIGDQVNPMQAGDVIHIPLHINHRVQVTSDEPCKIILERKAA